jgi:hypothetical protein
VLQAQPWPGNVRQLQNFPERLMVLSDGEVVTGADLQREPARQPGVSPLGVHAPEHGPRTHRRCGPHAGVPAQGHRATGIGRCDEARGVETIFRKRGVSIAECAILGAQERSGERGSDQHQWRWLFLVPCSTSGRPIGCTWHQLPPDARALHRPELALSDARGSTGPELGPSTMAATRARSTERGRPNTGAAPLGPD